MKPSPPAARISSMSTATPTSAILAPRLIHHNWFGPPLPDDVCVLLRENQGAVRGFKTILWASREFSDDGAFEYNKAVVYALASDGFDIEMREIEGGPTHAEEEGVGSADGGNNNALDRIASSSSNTANTAASNCTNKNTAPLTLPTIVTPEDLAMLRKLWQDTQLLRRLREEQPEVYPGLRVTWIAAISDFARMKAVHALGGIWADIGDTRFPDNFAHTWETLKLHEFLPTVDFRVGMNTSGIVRSPSQHLFAAPAGSNIVGAFIDRMRAVWARRISTIDVRDPAFDAIGTTLAFTGMGGTTGPIMRKVMVRIGGGGGGGGGGDDDGGGGGGGGDDEEGEECSLMDAWKRGWRHARLGAPVEGTDFVQKGRHESDVIATWSTKSWMLY